MIELVVRPAQIAVGSETRLTVRVLNRGAGPCSNVRVDLEVPRALGLCRGNRSVRLRRLDAAASHDEPLVLLPREAGTHLIGVPNLSYLDELGIPHRERGVTLPVVTEQRPGREASSGSDGSIFISYRRSDTGSVARSLAQDLDRAFPHLVFLDHSSLRPGDVFRPRLDRELAACEVLLALIGPRWLSTVMERVNDGIEDLVRHEIATALRRPDLVLIPVLVEGATVPSRAELVEDIAGLVDRQAVRLHSDTPTGRADLVAAIHDLRRR